MALVECAIAFRPFDSIGLADLSSAAGVLFKPLQTPVALYLDYLFVLIWGVVANRQFSAGRCIDEELRFTDKEFFALGSMALTKRMLDRAGFAEALAQGQLPPPGSNRGSVCLHLLAQFLR